VPLTGKPQVSSVILRQKGGYDMHLNNFYTLVPKCSDCPLNGNCDEFKRIVKVEFSKPVTITYLGLEGTLFLPGDMAIGYAHVDENEVIYCVEPRSERLQGWKGKLFTHLNIVVNIIHSEKELFACRLG
jgi:hypothetical protein